jgi:hypothetical protein
MKRYEESLVRLVEEYADISSILSFSAYLHECGKTEGYLSEAHKVLDDTCLPTKLLAKSLGNYEKVSLCDVITGGGERQYDSYGDSYSQLVAAIQEHLLVLGFEVGAVDGELNDKTKLAIQQYQVSAGLPESFVLRIA